MSTTDDRILEDMLQRATDPNVDDVDELAVRMFCTVVRNDCTLVLKSTELLVAKIKGPNITQSLRALSLLEECMSNCGPDFQKEVSKFRFLNELIRMVSKKYLAAETPMEIIQKIMDCLLLWTTQHPDKLKIREAYDMLRKEGVQHSPLTTVVSHSSSSRRDCCMSSQEEEKLRKLLQSQNPEDLKRANLLIQYVVKQDAKHTELRFRQKAELQEIQTTVDLLNQILDTWVSEGNDDGGESISLMKELYGNCEKYKPILIRLPDTIEEKEVDLIASTLEVNDALLAVMERYQNVPNHRNPLGDMSSTTRAATTTDLLSDLLVKQTAPFQEEFVSTLDELHDIFSATTTEPSVFSNLSILEPTPLSGVKLNEDIKQDNTEAVGSRSGCKTLAEIDTISEKLLMESLNNNVMAAQFKKTPPKFTLNELIKEKTTEKSPEKIYAISTILNADIPKTNDVFDNIFDSSTISPHNDNELLQKCVDKPHSEDEEIIGKDTEKEIISISIDNEPVHHLETITKVKSLSEIAMELDDVTPSTDPQQILLDEEHGLKVTFDFTENRPSMNVSVIVISVINQGKLPIDNFQIEASVKKPSKLRLLSATGVYLPGVKPFRPPTDSINQIILIYNPTKADVDVTCILGYKYGDDPDMVKESIVAKNIPYAE